MSRRACVAAGTAAAGLIAVLAALALHTPVAAGFRGVFRAVTPGAFLVLLGLAFVAAAAARLRPARSRASTPSPHASLVDRLEWPISVAVLAAAGGVVWYSLGRALVVPRIFGDELIHGEAARNLALHGTLPTQGYGYVTPALDSLAYLVTSSGVTAYRLIQVLNVAVAVSAAFLAYPLARRALSHRWALGVAALAVAVPWLTYARFVLTESDFYAVFLLFALALVRALERPTPRRQLLVAAALALTYLTRTQAVVLAGAVVVAVPLYGIAQARLRETLRAWTPTWALYLVGAAGVALAAGVGVWSPLGPYRTLIDGFRHPHGLAIWVAANLSALFLGLGVLIGLAAPLGIVMLLKRTAGSPAAALAAVSVSATAALLASVSLLSESVYGQGSVHERDLFFAAPLLLACALAWATNGCPRPRIPALGLAVLVVLFAATIPTGAIDFHLVDALSFKLWGRIDLGPLSPRAWIVAATAAGALVVLSIKSAWPVVLTVVLAAVGVAAASDYRSPESRAQAGRYAWVDKAVPGRADVMLLYVGYPQATCPPSAARSPLPAMSVYTEYFNLRVARVGHLLDDNGARGVASEKLGLRSDGLVTSGGRPVQVAYVVTDARLAVAGARTAALPARAVTPAGGGGGAGLALWRVPGPLRLLRPAQVLHPEQPAAC